MIFVSFKMFQEMKYNYALDIKSQDGNNHQKGMIKSQLVSHDEDFGLCGEQGEGERRQVID